MSEGHKKISSKNTLPQIVSLDTWNAAMPNLPQENPTKDNFFSLKNQKIFPKENIFSPNCSWRQFCLEPGKLIAMSLKDEKLWLPPRNVYPGIVFWTQRKQFAQPCQHRSHQKAKRKFY